MNEPIFHNTDREYLSQTINLKLRFALNDSIENIIILIGDKCWFISLSVKTLPFPLSAFYFQFILEYEDQI